MNDQPAGLKRIFASLRHEFGNMPLTFIASAIVLLDVIRSAIAYFAPSLAIGAGSAPVVMTIPSIPFPGVNLVVRLCLFLVIQGAFLSIYTRVQLALIRWNWQGLPIVLVIVGVIATWLSTFISFELAATAASETDYGIMLLIICSVSALAMLIYFVSAAIDAGNDQDAYLVLGLIINIAGLFLFTAFFAFELAKYFAGGHS